MEKNQYTVLSPIFWGGRREIGETLEMTEAEADNIGPAFLKPVAAKAPVQAAEPAQPAVTEPAVAEPEAAEPQAPRRKRSR